MIFDRNGTCSLAGAQPATLAVTLAVVAGSCSGQPVTKHAAVWSAAEVTNVARNIPTATSWAAVSSPIELEGQRVAVATHACDDTSTAIARL